MRKQRGRDGEDESTNLEGKRVKTKAYEFVWGGRERGLFACAYTLHTHLPFLQNWDILTQLKLTATIYEINNVRSSQPRTVAAYNWFSSFIWYMKQLASWYSFSGYAINCQQTLHGLSLVVLISLTSLR